MSRMIRNIFVSVAVAILVASASAQTLTPSGQDGQSVPKASTKARAPKQVTPKPGAKAASRRTTNKAVKIPAAANTITQELRREFEIGKLRSASDYFEKSPNAEMTAEVIAAMLTRRQGSSDSMDAYIKWQLLSGLPTPISEQLLGDAVAAYRNAPALESRPGMTPDQRKILDRALKQSDEPANIKGMLIDESRRIDILNEPVVSYREDLFAKLPDSFDVMQAGLLDLYQRAQAGVTPSRFIGKVAGRINKWSAQADQADIQNLSAMLDELLNAKVPDYYFDVRFDQNGNTYVWTSSSANLKDGKQLEDMAMVLGRKSH